MEVVPVFPRVKTISQLILTPSLPTHVLLQFLQYLPNALSTVDALKELCKRDYSTVFNYLLSLPFTHWHRRIMLSCLESRILNMKVDDIKSLSVLLPKLTALWYDEDAREWFPITGPMTDLETGLWHTHDCFYRLLHSRQMEGQYNRLVCDMSIDTFIYATLRFS